MVRTQLQLSSELHGALRREAHARGVSMSAVVREALAERYDPPRRTPEQIAVALRLIGAFSDPQPDVSERHDDYLHGDLE